MKKTSLANADLVFGTPYGKEKWKKREDFEKAFDTSENARQVFTEGPSEDNDDFETHQSTSLHESTMREQEKQLSDLKIKRIASIGLLVAAWFSAGAQATTPADWRLECVGRIQISLPSDVEVAAIPFRSLAKEIDGEGAMLSGSQFADGQHADWTRVTYINGLVLVSNEMEPEQIEDLRSRFSKQPKRQREYLRKRNTSRSRATVVIDAKIGSANALWWSSDSKIGYLQQLQNHLLYTRVSSESGALAESTQVFNAISTNTRYRELFSIPEGSGLCLPFVYINDKGSEPREVAVTYRIRSHPDVTVVLIDASTVKHESSIRSRNSAPKIEIENFWAQYEVSRTGKKVSPRSHLNSTRTIKMDGRTGLSSFVDITRKDNSMDYGFLAVVPGNSDANIDSPTLTLFVAREATHARAKGIEPIDEKAFLQLAEDIASSVRVRPRSNSIERAAH